MTRTPALLALCLACSPFTPAWTATAADAPVRAGRGQAALAFRSAEQTAWRVVDLADRLPAVCMLRSGGVGSRLVNLPGATLHLTGDVQLRLDAPHRQIKVEAGEICLVTAGRKSWSIGGGGVTVEMADGSAVRVTCRGGREMRVDVARGGATVRVPGQEAADVVTGPASWVFDVRRQRGQTGPLPATEQVAIEKQMAGEAPSQGLGQLLIDDAQSGTPRRLHVARYHVNAVIQPPVALVQTDQSFFNPFDRQQEGTFVFNLPHGASVSRFAMYVTPDQLIEGELIERSRAATIYNSIVHRRRDPAILEQIGDNLFRMRVFPIFANDTKRILLDYTLPVESQSGVYRFQLPLLSDLRPVWDFRVAGTIHGVDGPDRVTCETYPQLVTQGGADQTVAFELKGQDFRPQRDLVLSFRGQKATELAVRSYRAEPLRVPRDKKAKADAAADPWAGRNVTYFQAAVAPEVIDERDAAAPAADVLILADTSSGISSRKLLQHTVRTVVRNLRDTDRFHLSCVDVALRPLHDDWVTPQSAAADRVLSAFADQLYLGATDLQDSLETALTRFPDPVAARRRLIVYVGDGEDTVSDVEPPAFASGLAAPFRDAGVSFNAVAIDNGDWGRRMLEELAVETGGRFFDGHKSSSQKDLFGWLLGGMPAALRVVSVTATGVPEGDLFCPRSWLPGQPLAMSGRTIKPEALTIQLTVEKGGKTTTHRWPVAIDDRQDDVFIGRLWAQRKLRQLDFDREAGRADYEVNRRQILALSQEWSLLSPLTAFLVLETEQDYERWGIDRRARRRYWKPADVLPQIPLPPQWLARVQDASQELSADDRLAAALDAARQAFSAGRYHAALAALEAVARSREAQTSGAYAHLREQTLSAIRRNALVGDACRQFPLLDPRGFPDRLRPLAGSPLFSLPEGSWADAGHPLARRLVRQIEVPRQAGRSGDRLLPDWIEEQTGLTVDVDIRALEDEGIGSDNIGLGPLVACGTSRMSLWSYCRAALQRQDLVLLQREDGLLITTQDAAEDKLDTRVYPVTDLLRTDRVAQRDQLSLNPLFAQEQVAERRLHERLNQPVSFGFEEVPLQNAMEEFALQFGDNVMIDGRALADVGMGTDTPVTGRAREIPARQALSRILSQLDLDFMIDGEALVITTREEIEWNMKIRLYSGRNLLLESPQVVLWNDPRMWNNMGGRGANPFSMGGGMAGFGGGFGGGGGMAGGMGGGMGGFGGGGFGGGGLGGGGGAAGGPTVPTADTSLSQGGDGAEPAISDIDLDDAPVESATAATDGTDVTSPDAPADTLLPADRAPPETADAAPAPRMFIDADSTIDMITTTIEPIGWADVGGSASIEFFPPTIDLVVAASDRMHFEIEELLARLRGMPAATAPTGPWRLVHDPPSMEPNMSPDFDMLYELITTSVLPTVWVDAGGSCDLRFDEARQAMVLFGDQATHDQVTKLLTALRRSRYALQHDNRPWEAAGPGGLFAGGGVTRFDALQPRSAWPAPEPVELELLEVRCEPADGARRWRWKIAAGDAGAEFTLRQQADRAELQTANRCLRIEGELAAAGYPGLQLVEFGRWGAAAGRQVDACLPWLPHRSNSELARMFEIRRVDQSSNEEIVTLRFTPTELDPALKTYLQVGYIRLDGRPMTFEAYRQGILAGRLRFDEPAAKPLGAPWKQVTLEDATGQPLVQWELVESRTDGVEIPLLSQGWSDYAQLDRRFPEEALRRGLKGVLAAIRRLDWRAADHALQIELERHADRPLLRFLRAWCHEQDRDLGTDAEMISDLRSVAESRAVELTRSITAAGFPRLAPAQLYDIVSRQPPDTCTAADWHRLALAALEASQRRQALEHVQRSLAGDDENGDGDQFARVELLTRLLLQQERSREAVQAAEAFVVRSGPPARQAIRLADLLGSFALDHDADELLATALLDKAMPVPERCRLLLRRAEMSRDRAVSADWCWQVGQAGRLPNDRFLWACRLMNAAGQPEHVISLIEPRIRRGEAVLPPGTLEELEIAYRASGRPLDARRAYRQDPPHSEPARQRAPVMRGGGGFF